MAHLEQHAITLASGMRAVIERDRFAPGSWQLVVDGTPQSQVDPEQPTTLFFEYVQRIGHVIDQLRMPGQPITAVHLGAGALTLPRYVEATRPGSRQQVIELDRALVDLVRAHLPLPRGASIRIRYGDAREIVERLPHGLDGGVDLVVVDVFGGARIPAHVTSVEFYRSLTRLLAPDGVVAVNVADGPGLSFARGQVATLRTVFDDPTAGSDARGTSVAVLAEAPVLKGRRFGNLVLVASPTELPLEWMPRLLASGPHPAAVLTGPGLTDWIAGAPIALDATATGSPPPARSIFQVRGSADE